MSDLSIFVDESGSQEGRSKYYIVTYVLHDQDDDVASRFSLYEESLLRAGLPDIPFHANPLMGGNEAYADLPIGMLTALVGGPFFFWLIRRTRRAAGGWA